MEGDCKRICCSSEEDEFNKFISNVKFRGVEKISWMMGYNYAKQKAVDEHYRENEKYIFSGNSKKNNKSETI